jgi:hypothetical protein
LKLKTMANHRTPAAGAGREKAPKGGSTGAASVVVLSPLLAEDFVRTGTDRIVKVDGVSGVFTPIGAGDDQPLGADERKNLQGVIDRLKAALVELQATNVKLGQELTALRERPSAPDDFASAVQQSLDEVAQRMASMRNSMSNFAIREFKLDASVFVRVSPLGTIEYRFVQPGDGVDGAALSKISMSVVPVPKSNLAGVWTPDLFQPEVSLAALPQASPALVGRLESAGLFSIGEFLQVGTRARAGVSRSAARHRAQAPGAVGAAGCADDAARGERRGCARADRWRPGQLRAPRRCFCRDDHEALRCVEEETSGVWRAGSDCGARRPVDARGAAVSRPVRTAAAQMI